MMEQTKDITPESHEEKAWYHLSPGTWVLIAFLFGMNTLFFWRPELLDRLVRELDVRFWPLWYFGVLLIALIFSIQWYVISCRWRENEQDETDKRFLRFSVTVMAILLLFVVLDIARLLPFFYHPVIRWLGYGDFSWTALLVFTMLFAAIVPVAWFFKEWITS